MFQGLKTSVRRMRQLAMPVAVLLLLTQDRAVVQTTLVDQTTSGQLPIEYRLIHKGQRWAVYDVIVRSYVALRRRSRAGSTTEGPPKLSWRLRW
jgi:hypothetical protein